MKLTQITADAGIAVCFQCTFLSPPQFIFDFRSFVSVGSGAFENCSHLCMAFNRLLGRPGTDFMNFLYSEHRVL
jgi:hypothetical protein